MEDNGGEFYAASTGDYNADDLDCAVCADVLVDPCTLGCGHNFCQLCLAKVWREKQTHSSSVRVDSIECPFCRRPWYQFPEINLKLRNVVHKRHAGVVAAKQDEYQEEDKETLKLFHEAKLHRPAVFRDRVFRRAGRRPINSFMALLILASVLAFGGLMLGLLIYVLIMAGEGASGYTFKPVHQWEPHDVSDWVSTIAPFARDTISELVLKEGINGAHLLELNNEDLQEIGIDMTTRRRTLLLAIDELREVGFLVPKSFHSFKEKYFQETVTTATLYVLWPRQTLLMLYLTNYQLMFVPLLRFHFPGKLSEQPIREQTDVIINHSPGMGQLIAFFLLLLISPQYVLLGFAWSRYEMEPFVSSAVCLHSLNAMLFEVNSAYWWYKGQPSHLSVTITRLLSSAIHSTIQFVPAVLVSRVVWYFLPNFVWSALVYIIIFLTPCKLCFSLLKLLFLRRRNNVNINVQAALNFR